MNQFGEIPVINDLFGVRPAEVHEICRSMTEKYRPWHNVSLDFPLYKYGFQAGLLWLVSSSLLGKPCLGIPPPITQNDSAKICDPLARLKGCTVALHTSRRQHISSAAMAPNHSKQMKIRIHWAPKRQCAANVIPAV